MAFRRKIGFTDLPQPLIVKVLDDLDYDDKDLLTLRLVSKAWMAEIQLYPFSSILAANFRPSPALPSKRLACMVPSAVHLAFRRVI